jgi:hypothetical protein
MKEKDKMDELLKLAIFIASSLITAFLVPWLQTKLSASKYDAVLKIINALVAAVEQKLGADNSDGKLDYVNAGLLEKGFDASKFESEIEAAVLALHANGMDYAAAHGTVSADTTSE